MEKQEVALKIKPLRMNTTNHNLSFAIVYITDVKISITNSIVDQRI